MHPHPESIELRVCGREHETVYGICSVKETDWRAEIEAFGKGVAEDATEVQRHAQDAAREGAIRLEGLPHQAAKARLPHVDPEKFKSQIGQVHLQPRAFEGWSTAPHDAKSTSSVKLWDSFCREALQQ